MGSNRANITVEAKNTSTAAVAYPVSFPQNIVEDRLDRSIAEYRQPMQLRILSGQRHHAMSATASRKDSRGAGVVFPGNGPVAPPQAISVPSYKQPRFSRPLRPRADRTPV